MTRIVKEEFPFFLAKSATNTMTVAQLRAGVIGLHRGRLAAVSKVFDAAVKEYAALLDIRGDGGMRMSEPAPREFRGSGKRRYANLSDPLGHTWSTDAVVEVTKRFHGADKLALKGVEDWFSRPVDEGGAGRQWIIPIEDCLAVANSHPSPAELIGVSRWIYETGLRLPKCHTVQIKKIRGVNPPERAEVALGKQFGDKYAAAEMFPKGVLRAGTLRLTERTLTPVATAVQAAGGATPVDIFEAVLAGARQSLCTNELGHAYCIRAF